MDGETVDVGFQALDALLQALEHGRVTLTLDVPEEGGYPLLEVAHDAVIAGLKAFPVPLTDDDHTSAVTWPRGSKFVLELELSEATLNGVRKMVADLKEAAAAAASFADDEDDG